MNKIGDANRIVDFGWLIPQHVAARVGIASRKFRNGSRAVAVRSRRTTPL
jgi:hypothetical protein